MRALRHFTEVGLVLFLVFAAGVALTARSGDPSLFPAGEEAVEIVLISNGYHSGLILPLGALSDIAARDGDAALIAVATRFRAYPRIEIGWGDAEFYRNVPSIHSFQWRLAIKALLGLSGGSVLHVVGVEADSERLFAGAQAVRIRLSRLGFSRLASRLKKSFALGADRQPEALGPGLYGPSLFYRGTEPFNVFHVCNHWVADLLDAAGVPTSPILSILPIGLIADLTWRSHLQAVTVL